MKKSSKVPILGNKLPVAGLVDTHNLPQKINY